MEQPKPNLSFFVGDGPTCTCGGPLKVALQPDGNGLLVTCFRCGTKPFPAGLGLDGKIFLYLLGTIIGELEELRKQVKEVKP